MLGNLRRAVQRGCASRGGEPEQFPHLEVVGLVSMCVVDSATDRRCAATPFGLLVVARGSGNYRSRDDPVVKCLADDGAHRGLRTG